MSLDLLYGLIYLRCTCSIHKRTIINGGPAAPLKYSTFYIIITPEMNLFRVKSSFFQWCPREQKSHGLRIRDFST